MEPLDCPHCYTTVVPMKDGQCPACRQNVHTAPASQSRKGQLSVTPTMQLPPICCDCGEPTVHYVTVRRVRHDESESWFVRFIIGGLWYMLLRRIETANRLQVVLPQCELCGTKGAPSPVHVDFDNVRMTFAVNPRLKAAIAE